MSFQDFELDFRKGERDKAKRSVDEKKRALDAAAEHRNLLRSTYGSKLDYYKSHIPVLKQQIEFHQQESNSAYANREFDSARYHSGEARTLRAERSAAYDEKNRMKGEIDEADEKFRAALVEFREARETHQKWRDSFDERLKQLQEEAAKKRAEQEEGRRKHQEWRQSVIFRDGTPFLKNSSCAACSGSGKCPVCRGTGWVSDVSRCDSCYNDPQNGRKYHRCNTCRGTRLEPTTELSKDW